MEETNHDGQPFATGTRTAEANLKRNEWAEDSRPPESDKKPRRKECRKCVSDCAFISLLLREKKRKKNQPFFATRRLRSLLDPPGVGWVVDYVLSWICRWSMSRTISFFLFLPFCCPLLAISYTNSSLSSNSIGLSWVTYISSLYIACITYSRSARSDREQLPPFLFKKQVKKKTWTGDEAWKTRGTWRGIKLD